MRILALLEHWLPRDLARLTQTYTPRLLYTEAINCPLAWDIYMSGLLPFTLIGTATRTSDLRALLADCSVDRVAMYPVPMHRGFISADRISKGSSTVAWLPAHLCATQTLACKSIVEQLYGCEKVLTFPAA